MSDVDTTETQDARKKNIMIGIFFGCVAIVIVVLGIICAYYYDTNKNLGNPDNRNKCPTVPLPTAGGSVVYTAATVQRFHWRVFSSDNTVEIRMRCPSVQHEPEVWTSNGATLAGFVNQKLFESSFSVVDCARDTLFNVVSETTPNGEFTIRDANGTIVGYTAGGTSTTSMQVKNALGVAVMTLDYPFALPRKYTISRTLTSGTSQVTNMLLAVALAGRLDFSYAFTAQNYDGCNELFYDGAWSILGIAIIALLVLALVIIRIVRRMREANAATTVRPVAHDGTIPASDV